METLTLLTLVKGIAWGGSAGLVMWLASHYGDRVPAYRNKSAWDQRVLMIIVATIISFVCYSLVAYLPDSFWVAAQPYFIIAGLVAVPILGGQGIYLFRRAAPTIAAVSQMQPTVGQLDADMDKIRAAGMIVPDDHPLLGLLKERVQTQAEGSDENEATVLVNQDPHAAIMRQSNNPPTGGFDGHA